MSENETLRQQFYQVYRYGQIAGHVPKAGQIIVIAGTPDYGEKPVLILSDGVKTVAELYDEKWNWNKEETIPSSKVYSDKAVPTTGIPYSNQAVALFNGQTTGSQLEIMDLTNFKNWLNMHVQSIHHNNDVENDAPAERRCVIVGAGATGSPLVPLSLETFKEWLGIEESGETPPMDITHITYTTDAVEEALPENRRAVMVGAGDTGSTVTPLALDQFKEWLGIEESGGGNIRVSNIQMPSTGADFTGAMPAGGILSIDGNSGSQAKVVSLDGFKTWLANNFFDVLVQTTGGQWSGAYKKIPGYVINDSAGNGLELSQINQYGNTEYGSLPSIITGWHTGEGYLLWVSGRIVVAK